MNKQLLILFLIITVFCKAQDTSVTFAEVYFEKAWRIIDTSGNFILSQKYGVGLYQYLCFEDGLAISVNENSKFGFTDFNNKQVISSKYDAAQCFKRGFASVALEKKWGVINRQDKFIIQPEYDYAGSFGQEGLVGLIKNGKLGFADTTGKIIIPFKYYWMPSFNINPKYPFFTNGLIAIVDDNRKIGFMNTKGQLIIQSQYDLPGKFSGLPIFLNGTATVLKDKIPIVIDTLGNQVLKTSLESNRPVYFVDGFSILYSKSGHQGIISENGQVILEPKYSGVNPFSEGFAAVQISGGDEKGVISGFVNKKGQFVFDKKFGFIRDFHEGFAAVEVKGKWGYIDTTGSFIIKPQFLTAEDFYNGLAIVAIMKGKNFKYGFIDKKGAFVLAPIYDEANRFQYGLASVKIGDKYGYINLKGKVMIQPKFDNALDFQQESINYSK